MKETFLTVAAKVLGVAPETLSDASSPESVPTWDSLNGLLLVSELEKSFDVTFTMDEILAVERLGDFRALLAARGKDV